MLDYFVLFLMLGLAVMVLQLILVRLLGLRGRNVRAALCQLVQGVKLPTGFRDDLLVDRVLADPRIDPLSTGTKPSTAVTHITHVDSATFVSVLKDAFASAAPDILIEGFAKRPESVRVELAREIDALGPKVADHASRRFEGMMAAYADRYKGTMRILSTLLGIGLVIGLSVGTSRIHDYGFLGLGIVIVPVLAAAWYGLLDGVAKLRPSSEQTTRSAPRSAGSTSPSNRRRSQRGKTSSSGRGGSTDSSKSEASPDSGGSGGASRRRGRRSSGRRGGGRRGSGSGGSAGGGGSGSGS